MTRLKILSGMNIAEKRVPQDGRIKRTIGNQDVDFAYPHRLAITAKASCFVFCAPTR